MPPLDTTAVEEAVGTVFDDLGANRTAPLQTRLRDVLTAEGLTRIRRIAQDSAPLHIILEARS
ncbi:hypothetical protein [Streptomyces sp. NPDC056549]|uniref:hypothetical protein n=1 Tax=Streptomyces sp. NPDC056549 TaxID=3345864 RepID=UPI0036C23A73